MNTSATNESTISDRKAILLHPSDDVLVALHDLQRGDSVLNGNETIFIQSNVPAKHKVAIRHFNIGDKIKMYGVVIGEATQEIHTGASLTTQNLKHDSKGFEVRNIDYRWKAPDILKWKSRKFMGYHRNDGQVGTRNFWLVVPLVFCENRNVDYIKNAFIKKLGYAKPDKYEGLVEQLINEYKRGSLGEVKLAQANLDYKTSQRIFENIDRKSVV